MIFFSEAEINRASFGCDDGFARLDKTAFNMLNVVRMHYGAPMYLTCAYRTREHDISKGRSGNSDHCKGRGFDIKIESLKDAAKIIAYASKVGFNAFGIDLKSKFVHIGYRPELPGVVCWDY